MAVVVKMEDESLDNPTSPLTATERGVLQALSSPVHPCDDDDSECEEQLDEAWLAAVGPGSAREDVLRAWLLAAQFGLIGECERLEQLAKSYDLHVDSSDEDGYTALHRAAYGGHLSMVDWLLAR